MLDTRELLHYRLQRPSRYKLLRHCFSFLPKEYIVLPILGECVAELVRGGKLARGDRRAEGGGSRLENPIPPHWEIAWWDKQFLGFVDHSALPLRCRDHRIIDIG